jgi:hypothetical protein
MNPPAMTTFMAVVVEQVHERTGEDEKKGKHPEEVRRVLGDEIEASDQEETAEHQAAPRLPPGRPRRTGRRVVVGVA